MPNNREMRKQPEVVAVALANKNARIAWAIRLIQLNSRFWHKYDPCCCCSNVRFEAAEAVTRTTCMGAIRPKANAKLWPKTAGQLSVIKVRKRTLTLRSRRGALGKR